MGRLIVFNANAKTKGSEIAGRARDAGANAAKAAAASKAAQSAAATAQSAAQTAAQTAASAAQTAAQSVNSAAQTAAVEVSKGVKQGVYQARGWAAPVLENAAEYTTSTLAPKVSTALRSTAQQVRPEDVRKSKARSILTWSALGAALLAALGAAGVLVRKRYQDAMTADTEVDAAEGTATPADAAKAEADPTAASSEAGVNGRVSTSGW
jgi:hypothetical protein